MLFAALAALSFHACAGLLDAPYSPSSAAVEQAAVSDSWFEAYRTSDKNSKADIKKISKQGDIPPPLAIGITDTLHVSVKGKAYALEKKFEGYMREGAPVSYDEECQNPPRAGDKWKVDYSNPKGDVTVSLDLSLKELHTYGPKSALSEDWAPLDISVPAECVNVQESRLLYTGKLAVKASGKAELDEVVVQLIYEASERN